MKNDLDLNFDMDGVLFDFEQHYVALYDDQKFQNVGVNWRDMIDNDFFENIPILPEGVELFKFASELDFNIHILSTCGTYKHSDVCRQKRNALYNNDLVAMSEIYVVRNDAKSEYANANSLLIDDREICTKPFINAGGSAILFKRENLEEIKQQLLDL